MKKIFNGIVLILLILATGITSVAQENKNGLLKQVVRDNEDAVDAIAMYPRDTRKIIFEASEYPEIIAKLNSMQKDSQSAFETLIATLSKDEQDKIWNLTRYVDLISDLAADHRKSEKEINAILINYPEETRKIALEEGIKNYDLLVQIDKMNKDYNLNFESLLYGYPSEAVNAFREIIKLPEVLSILFDHMQYTVVIGDYYKKNPERVLHKTDSLNLVLTQKNTQEANDWKQSMNDNPQVQEEYTQAAQEYAQSNGYQPEDYDTPLTPDVTDYYVDPFNWWFGYPSWYPYNYWNPYAYWYDWGYYYGPGRHPIFFGLPSAYFMDWYFYYPEHFNRYPELSNHYYNYYNKHHGSINNNSISRSVNNWRNRNKEIVNADWDKDNVNRAQRFKQFGQMEMANQKYNTKHPQKQLDQDEFIQKKQRKYSTLSVDKSIKPVVQNNPSSKNVQANIPEPVKRPAVVIPTYFKHPENEQNNIKQSGKNSQQDNSNVPNAKAPNQTQISNPKYNNVLNAKASNQTQTQRNNQMRIAKQYHENAWTQPQQQRQPIAAPQREIESRPAPQPVRQESAPPSGGGGRRR